MATNTLTLDKLRPRNLSPDQDAYFRELERLLRQMGNQLALLEIGDGLTFDNIDVTFDSENITFDQVEF